MAVMSAMLVSASCAQATETIEWPDGKKAAIALTYDDALDTHLDAALPQLDAHGFKATFYLTLENEGFLNRTEEWRAVAENGHELGNHTLFHPCQSSLPGRDWVQPEADLDAYSVARMVREIALTNQLLTLFDGRSSRTFAYPCGDSTAGGESYVDAIRPLFDGARGVASYSPDATYDFYQVSTYGPEDVSGDMLIDYAEGVLEEGGFGSFTFHGIGGEYLTVSPEAHAELLDWLDAHRDEIWIATFQDIVTYTKDAG
ncbi:MAG: polysaccharide deacetylase family protein [Henriciella sp.]|uniref:polysaccharide deacetylase family protein n=1 Tax=Henriciella sp. TaxID=1968823 RepID=UPI003C75CD3A